MAYTDPTTVRVALTPGGDDADVGTAAYLNDADLNKAISRAITEVNAKLGVRYSVPFEDPAPEMVADIATDLAAYFGTLTARGGDPLDVRDPVALRYAAAELLLTQLQNGSATLAGATVPTSSAVSEPAVLNELDNDLFTVADFPLTPVDRFGWPGGSLTRP